MSQIQMHWTAWRDAHAAERAKQTRAWLEPEFLPAALEVIERPVSPTARWTARLLLVGGVLTGLWLTFGKLDIVATAPGSVMPIDNVKVVQPLYAGTVRKIAVRDGDSVRRGQLLVELDPTLADADEAEARKSLLAAELDIARYRAIVDGLSGGSGRYVAPKGIAADVAETQRRLVAATLSAQASQSQGLAASRQSALSDARAAERTVQTYSATAPLLASQLEAVRSLAAKGFASRFRLLELERQQRSELGSKQVAAAQVAKGYSDSNHYAQVIAQSREEARQSALQALATAQNEAMVRSEALNKARQQRRMQRLVAPVDGTVQQLAVHTVGGVIEAAHPVMIVVPEGTLTVEARLANKDAGFVKAGQPAVVKIEAYPFTQYGTVPAHIVSVSRNSVQDGDKPSYYVARIRLERQHVRLGDREYPLRSGMTATADIRTGRRTILSYLVSPVSSGLSEAGRER